MAESENWFKTLRRFGSRLRLNDPARRASMNCETEQHPAQHWVARYHNLRRRASVALGGAGLHDAVDDDGYSSSRVEIVRVPDADDEHHPCSSRDIQPHHSSAAESRQSDDESGEDRGPACHGQQQQHPGASDLPPRPPRRRDIMCRRPLPALPQQDGRVRALSAQLARLSYEGWYWGPLTLDETQEILRGLPDGSYLVRDSHNEAYLLAIGLRADGRTVHTRICHCNGRFMFAHDKHGSATSIDELLSNGVVVRGRYRQLLHPVSRLMRMRTLKEHSRFAIRRLIAIDRIDDLEIPRTLKGWLKENPY